MSYATFTELASIAQPITADDFNILVLSVYSALAQEVVEELAI